MDSSDIFIFSLPRGGKGESEAPGMGGGRFLLEIPRGGDGFSQEGGAQGPGGCLWGNGGRG